ncbi:hypothetical protein JZK55_21640 [Dissulfurispira thermophila]|uniref:Uncharacterized protein n=2 Tax=root TaxID=1 RepID=A0A7G1H572_9BACT|nr:hypothetical protein [Dissulfurispira thermophila]BCB97242.1 hypothetical protein JZK55_21640 [Dissulfurispira thermophila]
MKNWDEFAVKLKSDKYFNKFWRPEGISIEKMPAGKRLQGPVVIRQTTEVRQQTNR